MSAPNDEKRGDLAPSCSTSSFGTKRHSGTTAPGPLSLSPSLDAKSLDMKLSTVPSTTIGAAALMDDDAATTAQIPSPTHCTDRSSNLDGLSTVDGAARPSSVLAATGNTAAASAALEHHGHQPSLAGAEAQLSRPFDDHTTSGHLKTQHSTGPLETEPSTAQTLVSVTSGTAEETSVDRRLSRGTTLTNSTIKTEATAGGKSDEAPTPHSALSDLRSIRSPIGHRHTDPHLSSLSPTTDSLPRDAKSMTRASVPTFADSSRSSGVAPCHLSTELESGSTRTGGDVGVAARHVGGPLAPTDNHSMRSTRSVPSVMVSTPTVTEVEVEEGEHPGSVSTMSSMFPGSTGAPALDTVSPQGSNIGRMAVSAMPSIVEPQVSAPSSASAAQASATLTNNLTIDTSASVLSGGSVGSAGGCATPPRPEPSRASLMQEEAMLLAKLAAIQNSIRKRDEETERAIVNVVSEGRVPTVPPVTTSVKSRAPTDGSTGLNSNSGGAGPGPVVAEHVPQSRLKAKVPALATAHLDAPAHIGQGEDEEGTLLSPNSAVSATTAMTGTTALTDVTVSAMTAMTTTTLTNASTITTATAGTSPSLAAPRPAAGTAFSVLPPTALERTSPGRGDLNPSTSTFDCSSSLRPRVSPPRGVTVASGTTADRRDSPEPKTQQPVLAVGPGAVSMSGDLNRSIDDTSDGPSGGGSGAAELLSAPRASRRRESSMTHVTILNEVEEEAGDGRMHRRSVASHPTAGRGDSQSPSRSPQPTDYRSRRVSGYSLQASASEQVLSPEDFASHGHFQSHGAFQSQADFSASPSSMSYPSCSPSMSGFGQQQDEHMLKELQRQERRNQRQSLKIQQEKARILQRMGNDTHGDSTSGTSGTSGTSNSGDNLTPEAAPQDMPLDGQPPAIAADGYKSTERPNEAETSSPPTAAELSVDASSENTKTGGTTSTKAGIDASPSVESSDAGAPSSHCRTQSPSPKCVQSDRSSTNAPSTSAQNSGQFSSQTQHSGDVIAAHGRVAGLGEVVSQHDVGALSPASAAANATHDTASVCSLQAEPSGDVTIPTIAVAPDAAAASAPTAAIATSDSGTFGSGTLPRQGTQLPGDHHTVGAAGPSSLRGGHHLAAPTMVRADTEMSLGAPMPPQREGTWMPTAETVTETTAESSEALGSGTDFAPPPGTKTSTTPESHRSRRATSSPPPELQAQHQHQQPLQPAAAHNGSTHAATTHPHASAHGAAREPPQTSQHSGAAAVGGEISEQRQTDSGDCNIIVAGLTRDVDDAKLRRMFTPFGNVLSSVVMCRSGTGISRGFGFVLFRHEAEGMAAIEAMNGSALGPNVLRVNRSQHDGRVTETNAVFVRNLPADATDAEVEEVFSRCGHIDQVQIAGDTSDKTSSAAASSVKELALTYQSDPIARKMIAQLQPQFKLATITFGSIREAKRAVEQFHQAPFRTDAAAASAANAARGPGEEPAARGHDDMRRRVLATKAVEGSAAPQTVPEAQALLRMPPLLVKFAESFDARRQRQLNARAGPAYENSNGNAHGANTLGGQGGAGHHYHHQGQPTQPQRGRGAGGGDGSYNRRGASGGGAPGAGAYDTDRGQYQPPAGRGGGASGAGAYPGYHQQASAPTEGGDGRYNAPGSRPPRERAAADSAHYGHGGNDQWEGYGRGERAAAHGEAPTDARGKHTPAPGQPAAYMGPPPTQPQPQAYGHPHAPPPAGQYPAPGGGYYAYAPPQAQAPPPPQGAYYYQQGPPQEGGEPSAAPPPPPPPAHPGQQGGYYYYHNGSQPPQGPPPPPHTYTQPQGPYARPPLGYAYPAPAPGEQDRSAPQHAPPGSYAQYDPAAAAGAAAGSGAPGAAGGYYSYQQPPQQPQPPRQGGYYYQPSPTGPTYTSPDAPSEMQPGAAARADENYAAEPEQQVRAFVADPSGGRGRGGHPPHGRRNTRGELDPYAYGGDPHALPPQQYVVRSAVAVEGEDTLDESMLAALKMSGAADASSSASSADAAMTAAIDRKVGAHRNDDDDDGAGTVTVKDKTHSAPTGHSSIFASDKDTVFLGASNNDALSARIDSMLGRQRDTDKTAPGTISPGTISPGEFHGPPRAAASAGVGEAPSASNGDGEPCLPPLAPLAAGLAIAPPTLPTAATPDLRSRDRDSLKKTIGPSDVAAAVAVAGRPSREDLAKAKARADALAAANAQLKTQMLSTDDQLELIRRAKAAAKDEKRRKKALLEQNAASSSASTTAPSAMKSGDAKDAAAAVLADLKKAETASSKPNDEETMLPASFHKTATPSPPPPPPPAATLAALATAPTIACPAPSAAVAAASAAAPSASATAALTADGSTPQPRPQQPSATATTVPHARPPPQQAPTPLVQLPPHLHPPAGAVPVAQPQLAQYPPPPPGAVPVPVPGPGGYWVPTAPPPGVPAAPPAVMAAPPTMPPPGAPPGGHWVHAAAPAAAAPPGMMYHPGPPPGAQLMYYPPPQQPPAPVEPKTE